MQTTETKCDNCGTRPVVGLTGNGERACEECLWAEYRYAQKHVPEALAGMTFARYREECAAHLSDELPKSAGQLAYEADVAADPKYHDGAPRRAWSQLTEIARESWERNPTPRQRSNKETR